MVVLKAVLLRSVVGVAAILIALVGTALTITHTTPGVRLWADLVTGLTATSTFTGLIAAGAAAVEANRWSNSHATRHASASRPRWSIRATHAAAVVVPLALGFWVAVGALSVYAIATRSYGTPPLIWLLSLFCALLIAASIGYVVGAVLPYRWYVGPAAGAVFYVGYILLLITRPPYGYLALYPASTNYDSAFVRTVTKTFVAQSGFFLAGSFVALLVYSFGKRFTNRSFLALLGGVVVIALAGGTVIATDGLATTGHNPRTYECSGHKPVLCLNPGYVLASQSLHREFAAMNGRAAGTPLAATRLEQNIEGNDDAPSRGSRFVYLEQWASHTDLTFAASRYVDMYGGLDRCTSNESGTIEGEINVWLSGYNPAYGAPDPVITRLSRLSTSEGNSWFKKNYPSYAKCTLKTSDLP